MSIIELSKKERDACEKMVVYAEGLPSQRATALLAVHGGTSQAEAARQSGLTPGQVRYLLTAFAKKRLAIFPEDAFIRDAPSEVIEQIATADEATAKTAPASESKPKKGKSKKDKAKKADKESKKGKKAKKEPKKKHHKKKDGKKKKKK
jgi:hypothetical protein